MRWLHVDGTLRFAVVLAPDRPMPDPGVVSNLGSLALFDAMAALAPPQVPVHLTPPGGLSVDGAQVAAVRSTLAPSTAGEVPEWAVLGFEVDVSGHAADPGGAPDRTSLHEEGFGDVTAADVLVNTLRHLLMWMDAWGQDGPAALEPALRGRTAHEAVAA